MRLCCVFYLFIDFTSLEQRIHSEKINWKKKTKLKTYKFGMMLVLLLRQPNDILLRFFFSLEFVVIKARQHHLAFGTLVDWMWLNFTVSYFFVYVIHFMAAIFFFRILVLINFGSAHFIVCDKYLCVTSAYRISLAKLFYIQSRYAHCLLLLTFIAV